MSDFLWLILVPVVGMAVVTLTELAFVKRWKPIRAGLLFKNIENDYKYVALKAGFRLCLLVVLLCAAELLGVKCMQVSVVPSWVSFIVTSFLAGEYIIELNGGDRARHFVQVLSVSAIILFLLEIFVFNVTGMTDRLETSEVNLATVELDGEAVFSDGELTLNADTDLFIDAPEGLSTVVIHIRQMEYERRYRLVCSMEDNNFAYSYVDVRDMYLSAQNADVEFTIKPYGKMHSVALRFSDLPDDFTITGIEFKSAQTYHFSALRYFVLLLLVSLVSLVFTLRLYAVAYTGTFGQELGLQIICALCILTVLIFIDMETGFEIYPFEEDASGHNPYVQTFDAFMKGQVNLDIPVSEELQTLADPYDVSARRLADVKAAWDRAFYDGKYYSYFGVTPVFLVVAPLYFLTGYVPGNGIMIFIFAMFAGVFLCFALSQVIKTYVKKPNLLLTYLMYPTAFAVSGIYLCLQYNDQYYVAGICSLANIYMCLYFGFRAINTEAGWRQNLCLLLSGLGLSFALGGRLTACFASLLLAPAFIGLLTDKTSTLKRKITQSVSFLTLPVVTVFLLLLYNKLRFGSFTDFGAEYQLTISNINANSLHITYIFEALWRYFLQLPVQITSFPYIEMSYLKVIDLGGYMYTDGNLGVLSVPIILLGAVLMCKSQGRRICAAEERGVLEQRAFHWICIVVAVFVAWFDFCQGGVNIRYTMDIMPCMLLLSAVAVLRTTKKPGTTRYILAVVAMVLSILFVWALMVTESGTVLARMHGGLVDDIENLILFWK